jgi:hypothetical protein
MRAGTDGEKDARLVMFACAHLRRRYLSPKPANVMLHQEAGVDGQVVKVLDFGVTKNLATNESLVTAQGCVVGSPAYMSPEAIQGARDLDARTDIWALGVRRTRRKFTPSPESRGTSDGRVIARSRQRGAGRAARRAGRRAGDQGGPGDGRRGEASERAFACPRAHCDTRGADARDAAVDGQRSRRRHRAAASAVTKAAERGQNGDDDHGARGSEAANGPPGHSAHDRQSRHPGAGRAPFAGAALSASAAPLERASAGGTHPAEGQERADFDDCPELNRDRGARHRARPARDERRGRTRVEGHGARCTGTRGALSRTSMRLRAVAEHAARATAPRHIRLDHGKTFVHGAGRQTKFL